jgi:hypothetical protein
MAVGSRTATVMLVVLIIHYQVFLVLSIEDPALVCVSGTLVSSHRHELRVLLIGNIVDGLSYGMSINACSDR